jgi:hypothetical protein
MAKNPEKRPDLDEPTLRIAQRMLSMPPKRHEDMKIGKPIPKRAKNPAKRLDAEKPQH